MAFYAALGKVPRVLRKEIQGFVANRLQRAIFRECCYLVQQGVCSVDELDDIVTNSIGLRWAVNGPFSSFHMGGGPGGFTAFFKQFAPEHGGGLEEHAAGHARRGRCRQLIIDAGEGVVRQDAARADGTRARRQADRAAARAGIDGEAAKLT